MDAEVDDFFNEINEIAPPKPSHEEPMWKKCHDEVTGYPYYWNVNTAEVTWEVPPDFNPLRQNSTRKTPGKKPEIPLNSIHSEAKLKILEKAKPKVYRKPKNTSDSDDEKITLISSYGGDTESETEDEPEVKKQKVEVKQDSYLSESEDDVDILAKIQKRAKELKALGGELPPEVAKIADTNNSIDKKDNKNNMVSSISLVAGYSDSEEENEEVKTVLNEDTQTSCSTLFPIAQKIDVKDFMEPRLGDNKQTENDFTSKAFSRKKRIDVPFVNTGKKTEDFEDPDNERKGFGYSEETKPTEKGTTYLGFTKGGVIFAKPKAEEETYKKTENEVNKQELDDMYNTLREKLEFLNEGRPEVPPTQVMVIQVETLRAAVSNGGLKPSYLQNWLKETCTELIKLEKESTPEGWLLQWDRSHKRYYYQNMKTGASQWEYPQLNDVERCDDAMDISTTPPPEQVIRMSPPLPPVIRCPTPPPPPIISEPDDVPLPPNSPPPMKQVLNGEPLPPGVDLPDIPTYVKKDVDDSLNTALDSFYSEVAAIESPKSMSPQPPPLPVEETKTVDSIDVNTDSVKKKKKKVKLAPGLALKKKGVSQLVEKWKSVQQQLNKD